MSSEQYAKIMFMLIVIAIITLISGLIGVATILEINEMVYELIEEIK